MNGIVISDLQLSEEISIPSPLPYLDSERAVFSVIEKTKDSVLGVVTWMGVMLGAYKMIQEGKKIVLKEG